MRATKEGLLVGIVQLLLEYKLSRSVFPFVHIIVSTVIYFEAYMLQSEVLIIRNTYHHIQL